MAAPKRHLHPVEQGETAPKSPPKVPKNVLEAAKTGDHRALLVAMRDRIALTIAAPECPPRDLASLSRRLQDIAKEIEAIDLRRREEGSDADDVDADEDFDPSTL